MERYESLFNEGISVLQKRLKDLSPLQKKIVDYMLRDKNTSSLTAGIAPAKEVRIYDSISKNLGMFKGNTSLSKAYDNKPFGEYQDALQQAVKEMNKDFSDYPRDR